MPFTFSHPAAVLPLLRRPFVPTALIAGTVAPDLPYFLNVPVTAESWYEPFVNATFSHSLKGLLLVGLPSVVLLVILFRATRSPLGDLLPLRLGLKTRAGMQGRSWFSFGAWFLISALIGLATHVVWDSVTNGGSLLGVNLPFLRAHLVADLTVDRFLQHASTILGAIAIVVWCVKRFRSRELLVECVAVSWAWVTGRAAIIVSIVVASVTFAVLPVWEVRSREGSIGVEHALSLFFKTGLPIAVGAMLIYAAIWHIAHFSRRAKVSRLIT